MSLLDILKDAYPNLFKNVSFLAFLFLDPIVFTILIAHSSEHWMILGSILLFLHFILNFVFKVGVVQGLIEIYHDKATKTGVGLLGKTLVMSPMCLYPITIPTCIYLDLKSSYKKLKQAEIDEAEALLREFNQEEERSARDLDKELEALDETVMDFREGGESRNNPRRYTISKDRVEAAKRDVEAQREKKR